MVGSGIWKGERERVGSGFANSASSSSP